MSCHWQLLPTLELTLQDGRVRVCNIVSLYPSKWGGEIIKMWKSKHKTFIVVSVSHYVHKYTLVCYNSNPHQAVWNRDVKVTIKLINVLIQQHDLTMEVLEIFDLQFSYFSMCMCVLGGSILQIFLDINQRYHNYYKPIYLIKRRREIVFFFTKNVSFWSKYRITQLPVCFTLTYEEPFFYMMVK